MPHRPGSPAAAFSATDLAKLLISDVALPELTPAQALRLAPWMRLTQAPPNAVLFRAGGPSDQFMVMLLAGDAVVEGQLTGGAHWVTIRSLVPGSLFGELGALDSIGRSVVVRATTEVALATLDDPALQRITDGDPSLTFALLRAMLGHVTRRLRAANSKIHMLHNINQAMRDEWAAQSRSDQATGARLKVLLKLEKAADPVRASNSSLLQELRREA